MGRGLGAVQRRILELLETVPPDREVIVSHRKPEGPDGPGWTIADLARVLGLTAGRTRVAVRAMEERRLIASTWEDVAVLRRTSAAGGQDPVCSQGWVIWTHEQVQQWRPDAWPEIEEARDIADGNAWWAKLTPEERRAQLLASYARGLAGEFGPGFRAWYDRLTPEQLEAEIQERIAEDRCYVPYPPITH